MKFGIAPLLLVSALWSSQGLSAPIVVKNDSNANTLFVAAIIEAQAADTSPSAKGFWKVEPGKSTTLAADDSGVKTLWLRVFVSRTGQMRDFLPLNREYLDLRGGSDCEWTSTEPSRYLCSARRVFSMSNNPLQISLGDKTTSNHLRDSLEQKGRYKFFKLARNSSSELVFVWK